MSADPLAHWSERFNPLVVKELRQGLRSRTFWGPFALLLLAGLLISLIGFSAGERTPDTGDGVFAAQLVVLALVQLLVLPVAAFRSMAAERNDETWVLLTLTGLGARRILRGKVSSFLVQGVLFVSVAAPFLLFSYALNGIDLLTIAVTLTSVHVLHIFLVTLAVSLATLADSKLARGLVQLIALVGLLQCAWAVIMLLAVAFDGRSSRLLTFAGRLEWLAVVSLFFGLISTAVLALEGGASRLALSTENYAKGVRLAFAVQFLGGAALLIAGAVTTGEHNLLVVGAGFAALYVMTVGVVVASDVDGKPRTLPDSVWAPGAFRGLTLVVLTTLVVNAAFIGAGVSAEPKVVSSEWDDLPRWFLLLLALPAFTLIYLCAPHVVGRWFSSAAQVPVMVRGTTVALVLLGSLAPPLVGNFVSRANSKPLNVLNPIVGLANLAERQMRPWALWVPWLAAAAMTGVALAVVRRRDTRRA